MTTRALERVDGWETRSYTGGYRGIHELADQAFSGVVRAGMATLCMLNGSVVGVLDGTIEDFADADGTAYVAPTPALPLLVVMQERSDEVRAKYYTEDTPLSKVDGTLEDGGFTGFVELSENVLSGDYYVVYHGGRSMSVAFVGERGQLLTEEEAFDRADDEVGIYEVRPVEIEVVDVPEPEPEPEPTPSATAVGADAGDSATGAAETVGADSASDDSPSPDADVAGEADTGDGTGAESPETIEEPNDRAPVEEPPTRGADEDMADERTSDADVDTDPVDTDAADPSSADAPSSAEADDVAGSSSAGADESEMRSDTGADRPATESRKSAGSDRGGARSRADEAGQAAETRSTTGQAEPTDEPRRSTERSPSPAAESRTGGTDVGGGRTESSSASHPGAGAASSDRPGGATAGRSRDESAGGASDLEIRTIPSLDPSRSWGADEEGPKASTVSVPPVESDSGAPSSQRSSDHRSDRSESGDLSPATVEEQSTAAERTAPSESNGRRSTGEMDQARQQSGGTESSRQQSDESGLATGATDERVRELEEIIGEREARIDDLEARVEKTEAKRDQLEAERDQLETERDELREELSAVRSELQSLKDERDALETQLDGLDVGTDGVERQMSRPEAIEGTNLFVRYGSKSAPTLAAARESGASQSDVRENLSVEYHTQFEVEGTLVEGHPFEEFLRGTMEHQFVTWVVTELLFEIRDTGHREALSDLYDALPHVDRVELNGSVGVEFDEDGQTKRSQESFDVVFRDRMGDPLLVANMNDSRQAATENQMNSLVTAATRVGETSDSLAGAMFVTSSFFEPAALETTSEATGGGLLSRDKRESFVKLSRKQGYHLCLVEARDDQFHMAVPEL